jgi:hypothetical protein
MKRPINWQNQRLKVHLYDLNQLVVQQELPKRLSGTEQIETTKKHWESLTGLKQTKGLIQSPSVTRNKELLKVNRNQLQ